MKVFVVDDTRSRALRALNYSPAIERIRRAGSNSARPLREVVRMFGPAYGTVFTRLDCQPDHGVELVTQSDMFAAEPQGRVIRRDCMPEPERHLIKRGHILIAGAGTLGENEIYGRALLADNRLAGKYVGPDAMTLVFEDSDDDFSLFSYAWLASPTGVQAIRATSYGTKILRFREDLLTALPVPIASRSIVKRVADLIRQCTSSRERYAEQIGEARHLLEQMPDMHDALKACSNRTRRSIWWSGPLPSIRAWNFAAGGGIVHLLGRNWKTQLREVITSGGIFNGPRFARAECLPPHGIDFLSQRDVFMIRPVGRRIAVPDIPKRLLFVPRNALLVGSHGQMNEGSIFGKVELASFAGWRSGVTQDILRVLPQDGYRELTYAFLSTTVGQWLLKSTAVGTSIPSMRVDLLERLPFPDPSSVPLDDIRQHVLNAEEARIAADVAEAAAIRIIEEEVLPQWLA